MTLQRCDLAKKRLQQSCNRAVFLQHSSVSATEPYSNAKESNIHASWGAAVCCSVLQCVAVCCSVLQCAKESNIHESWGAGVEIQKNVRGEIGGWGRVPFNEPYAPSLSSIYDGA